MVCVVAAHSAQKGGVRLSSLPRPPSETPAAAFSPSASLSAHLRTNLEVNLLKMPVAPWARRAWVLPCDSEGEAGPLV